MKFIISIIVLFLELLWYSNCSGQHFFKTDSTRSYFIGSKFQAGYILVNNGKVASIIQREPVAFQVDFSMLKNEQRIWDYGKCYAKNGVSLSYVDFGNAKNLGKALSLAIFTEPILVLSERIQFTLRAGVGFSYLNKIYNKQTNPDNICYSNHISFLLMLNPNIYYRVGSRTYLSLGAQFNHISNGALRYPNWGINFPTSSAGIEYTLNPNKFEPRKSTPFNDRSIKMITHIFSGSHSADPTATTPEIRRGVGGVNIGIIKPLGRINALGVGGEIYYDGISKVLEAQSGKNYRLIISSVSLQHYFFFGRILFGQQLACYVTRANPNVATKIYQRYFLEYKINKSLYAGISLAAHGGISDYLALSSGFIF